ncbi:MAG: DUF5655 domain-containing protein [Bulleidia sp.]|nr:DUF5655 domain-containing protein [Bulleidia sp.]
MKDSESMEECLTADEYHFFEEHMDALPIYEALKKEILKRIPDVQIKVSKTQISFIRKHGFAFVSFLPCRRAKERPAVWLTVSFGLGYRKDSERIDIAVEPYPGRWTHHVMIGSINEIDEELLSWINEAADFAMTKGRHR